LVQILVVGGRSEGVEPLCAFQVGEIGQSY